MNSFLKGKAVLIAMVSLVFFLNTSALKAQSKTFDVKNFDKVIISPHIEVVFKAGDKESVIIESMTEPINKIHVEVKGSTLHVYLDDAKMVTKSKKDDYNKNYKNQIYNGTVVKATVIYKKVKTFSLRGEERFEFESPIDANKLTLNIYGESQVYMNDVTVQDLKVTIYGESYLKIEKGNIVNQKITSYGESKVNTLEADNKSTKVTAYGEGSFQFNVSEKLKIISYGEATVAYKGDAVLDNGLSIGEVEIVKID